jgi:hypothetical protein
MTFFAELRRRNVFRVGAALAQDAELYQRRREDVIAMLQRPEWNL